MSATEFALSISVLLAIVFILIVRLADLNEREPLWAVTSVLFAGVVAGLVLRSVIGSSVLTLDVWRGAAARQVCILIAILAGVAFVELIAAQRGWPEVVGPIDGLVYGVAGGLGVSVANTFVDRLIFGDLSVIVGVSRGSIFGFSLLTGLWFGIYGAVLGVGISEALTESSWARRLGFVSGAFAIAVLLDALQQTISPLSNVTGGVAQTRSWIVLAAPVVVLSVIAAYSLVNERRRLRRELEADRIVQREYIDEALSLRVRWRRNVAFIRAGRFSDLYTLRVLRIRVVQLAALRDSRLVKSRSDTVRAGYDSELRESISRLQAQLCEPSAQVPPTQVAETLPG